MLEASIRRAARTSGTARNSVQVTGARAQDLPVLSMTPTESAGGQPFDLGHQDLGQTIRKRAELLAYSETIVGWAGSGAVEIDVSRGNVWHIVATGPLTISCADPPAVPDEQVPSGITARRRGWGITLYITSPGSANDVTWSDVSWGDNGEPDLSKTSGKVDIVVLVHVEGINRWMAMHSGGGF